MPHPVFGSTIELMPADDTFRPIEINPEFERALDIMENSGKSIFVTGRAGTGKSTLLSYFCQTTKKKVAVLAPTGVAALNVKGRTIHSFFKFRPTITVEMVKKQRFHDENANIYRKLDMIIIDEISMVRADLLDCVDRFMRLNGRDSMLPFGGVQMVFIGDLYQLPPVVTSNEREVFRSVYESPYFYSAHLFKSFEMEFLELQKVYRQSDAEFIGLLNAIRNRSIGVEEIEAINERCLPGFQPRPGERYVYLTTTNAMADSINTDRLGRLKNAPHAFTAEISGDFGKEYYPTAVDLHLKPRAQVMMLNNDSSGRWVNGSIGEITRIYPGDEGQAVISVELDEGETVEVTPFTWEISSMSVREGQLQSEVVGTFTQYPMMLAWAVTIHKSQGKTFDRVIIDFGRGTFAHGQAYVALSRCTSLEGIVLTRPLRIQDILTDFDVVRFLTRYQYMKAEEQLSYDDKSEILWKAIKNKAVLEIEYLKPDDEKSVRMIRPETIGEFEYRGKIYQGVRAFCLMREDYRTFRIDRILKIKEVQDKRPDRDKLA